MSRPLKDTLFSKNAPCSKDPLPLSTQELKLIRTWFQFSEQYSPDYITVSDADAALYFKICNHLGLSAIRMKAFD